MGNQVATTVHKLLEVFEKRPWLTILLVLLLAFMMYEYSHKPVPDGEQRINSTGDGNTNTNVKQP
jgi:hypothetical protein